MLKLLAVPVAAALFLAVSTVAGIGAAPRAGIILVGDSTVTPEAGWGGLFCGRHVAAGVGCVDLAVAGRSSRSYLAEGRWTQVAEQISSSRPAAPFVLIQFGINDATGTPDRQADPVNAFPANLRRFVAETRSAGGIPILITTLARRRFKDGRFADDLEPWAEATRRVARDTHTPLLDLHRLSGAMFDRMGHAASQTLGLPGTEHSDDTHLGARGALLVSALVAGEARRRVPAMRALVVR